MPVYSLPNEPIFPSPLEAEDDGLIAVGGDLSPERLLNAYANGIFPWFGIDNEYYWYAPNPRMVIYPSEIKVSKSLKSLLRSGRFSVTFNKRFESVIKACADVSRIDQEDTWITDAYLKAFHQLHLLGYSHSVEVWENGALVGGLYGQAIGKVFFGESMFHLTSNASKVALVALAIKLVELDFELIDCQQDTDHIRSMGGKLLTISAFVDLLSTAVRTAPLRSDLS